MRHHSLLAIPPPADLPDPSFPACHPNLDTCRRDLQQGGSGLTIHVAPGGDDRWSGALTQPNATRSDGPLASLEGARDRIRRLRLEQRVPTGPITVLFADGTYPVSGPVVFETPDKPPRRLPR